MAKSKVGSLENAKHKPAGGDKKVFDEKLPWAGASPFKKQIATANTSTSSLTHKKPGVQGVGIQRKKESGRA